MNLLARLRSGQARWGSRPLLVLLIAWFNLALQPCAMAFAADKAPHCPDCPPALAHEHAGQEMPGETMDTGAVPCAAQIADCANLDDVNHHARDGLTKALDPPNTAWIAFWPVEPRLPVGVLLAARTCVDERPCPPGAYPPLNVLYCVYLD